MTEITTMRTSTFIVDYKKKLVIIEHEKEIELTFFTENTALDGKMTLFLQKTQSSIIRKLKIQTSFFFNNFQEPN